ncbi:hypothetical protein C1645_760322 [Glomus cerebriforme]|uniref:Uncharacterized protein n=1 Tax=Glomus cerebriforme TaxID=658196 RepID=A0A397T848_9GLOM|nr:hypothetical protein C1645_760322 [Glomus cerebriforme]
MCQAESGQTICKAPECDRPIYVETNGVRHPFCGRKCASKYGDYIYPSTTCKRVGCNNPTFVEPNGRVHPYCGRSCAHIDQMNPLSQDGLLLDLGNTTEQLNPSPALSTTNSTIVSDLGEDFVVM